MEDVRAVLRELRSPLERGIPALLAPSFTTAPTTFPRTLPHGDGRLARGSEHSFCDLTGVANPKVRLANAVKPKLPAKITVETVRPMSHPKIALLDDVDITLLRQVSSTGASRPSAS